MERRKDEWLEGTQSGVVTVVASSKRRIIECTLYIGLRCE